MHTVTIPETTIREGSFMNRMHYCMDAASTLNAQGCVPQTSTRSTYHAQVHNNGWKKISSPMNEPAKGSTNREQVVALSGIQESSIL
mmetsp:Transcript_19070/g.52961  ORF Transcript_19070/g.52961 Transcript_19070/m.52961 type:complete len:87 (-) Transcript_19070:60-320(-)